MIEEPEEKLRFVMNLLYREKVESSEADHNVKVTLFDINSGRQDVFVYTEKEILNEE